MIIIKRMSRFAVVGFAFAMAFTRQNGVSRAAQAPIAEADQLDAQVGTLFAQQKYDQALALAQKELVIRENALGPDHPSVGAVHRNIAEIFFAKGKYHDACLEYRRFLGTYEKTAEANSSKLVDVLDRYLTMLIEDNERNEALTIQKRVFLLDNGFDFDQLVTLKGKNVLLGGLMQSVLTTGPVPINPPETRSVGIAGPVLIKLSVDDQGHLSAIKVLSGRDRLAQAAELAARRSTFLVPTLAGKPVGITGILIYNFTAK